MNVPGNLGQIVTDLLLALSRAEAAGIDLPFEDLRKSITAQGPAKLSVIGYQLLRPGLIDLSIKQMDGLPIVDGVRIQLRIYTDKDSSHQFEAYYSQLFCIDPGEVLQVQISFSDELLSKEEVVKKLVINAAYGETGQKYWLYIPYNRDDLTAHSLLDATR